MGKEAACAARQGGVRAEGKAHLDTGEVVFRAPVLRIRIPRKDISAIRAEDGVLTLAYGGGEASFELGAQAARWAEELRNPRTRADKLGVKPGQRARLQGVTDALLVEELASRGVEVVASPAAKGLDLVFLQADAPKDLARVAKAAASLAPTGALWVVTPRGVEGVKDTDVMAAARAAGLVDVKVVRFNETHTALKLVVPKAKR